MHDTGRMQSGLWLKNLNKNDCIEDLGIDGLDRLVEKILISQRDAAL